MHATVSVKVSVIEVVDIFASIANNSGPKSAAVRIMARAADSVQYVQSLVTVTCCCREATTRQRDMCVNKTPGPAHCNSTASNFETGTDAGSSKSTATLRACLPARCPASTQPRKLHGTLPSRPGWHPRRRRRRIIEFSRGVGGAASGFRTNGERRFNRHDEKTT